MSILVERKETDYEDMPFAQVRLEPGFAISTAHAMAWMSQLAYETAHEEKIRRIAQKWTIESVEVVRKPARDMLPFANTHGIIVRKARCCIIAFAGTDPTDLVNWITDFYLGSLFSGVHQGFQGAADAVWTQVGDQIRKAVDAGETLFVTGHSLGAALALATLDKARAEIPILQRPEVYTFGCPRVGREAFRDRYNKAFGPTTYRLVYGDDLVATVPPTEFDFHHVGRLLSCARGKHFQVEDMEKKCDSDAPLANAGIFGGIFHRLRGLVTGPRSLSSREDIFGELSELLSPSIGDHLPDRYIAALV